MPPKLTSAIRTEPAGKCCLTKKRPTVLQFTFMYFHWKFKKPYTLQFTKQAQPLNVALIFYFRINSMLGQVSEKNLIGSRSFYMLDAVLGV